MQTGYRRRRKIADEQNQYEKLINSESSGKTRFASLVIETTTNAMEVFIVLAKQGVICDISKSLNLLQFITDIKYLGVARYVHDYISITIQNVLFMIISEVLMWLGEMYKQGVKIDEVIRGIAVQAYNGAREFCKAMDFDISPSMESYSNVVDMLGSCGYLNEAFELIERMLVEPIIIFIFMNLHSSGQTEGRCNLKIFIFAMMESFGQNSVIFFIPYLAYRHSTVDTSGISDLWTFTFVILVKNTHLGREASSWYFHKRFSSLDLRLLKVGSLLLTFPPKPGWYALRCVRLLWLTPLVSNGICRIKTFRYLLYIKIFSVESLVAGKISPIYVRPCVVLWSDRSHSQFGKRRSFIIVRCLLIFATVSVITLFGIGFNLNDIKQDCNMYVTPQWRAGFVFVTEFWKSELSNNAVQGPARTLMIDFSGSHGCNAAIVIRAAWVARENILDYSSSASEERKKWFHFLCYKVYCEVCANLKGRIEAVEEKVAVVLKSEGVDDGILNISVHGFCKQNHLKMALEVLAFRLY